MNIFSQFIFLFGLPKDEIQSSKLTNGVDKLEQLDYQEKLHPEQDFGVLSSNVFEEYFQKNILRK